MTTKQEAKKRTQRRSGSQVQSFSSCSNHSPERGDGRGRRRRRRRSPVASAERCKQVQSWPSCSSTFRDASGARGLAPGSLPPPRRPPPRAASFLLHWVLGGLPTPGLQLLAARRAACAGHVPVPGARGERGAEGGAEGGRWGGGQGAAPGAQARGEGLRAGPPSPGLAAHCLPEAVRSERRRTRGRRRAGPSSHTPGPGCH